MPKNEVSIKILVKDLASRVVGNLQSRLSSLATTGLEAVVRWGKRAAFVIGTTLVGAFGLALRAATRFQTRMAEVGTLLGGDSRERVAQLSDEILRLSKVVPQDPDDLGAGLYQIFSAGVTDAAEALKVLEVSSKAAVGGLADTFSTVDAITTVLNSYGLAASQAEHVSDVFFETVKQGKITLPLIASTIGDVAATASLADVSLEELGAAIATMTKSGINAAETMTSLNRLFLSLTSPTEEAQKAARRLGVDWSIDAVKAKGLQEVLRELNEAAGGNIKKLQQIVPELRAFRAVSIIAGKAAQEYQRQVGNMERSTGAADEAFRKMMETWSNQIKLARNELRVVLIEIGREVMPELVTATRDAVDRLEDFSDWIKDHKQDLRDAASLVRNLAGAFLGVIEWAGKATLAVAGFLAKLAPPAEPIIEAFRERVEAAKDDVDRLVQISGAILARQDMLRRELERVRELRRMRVFRTSREGMRIIEGIEKRIEALDGLFERVQKRITDLRKEAAKPPPAAPAVGGEERPELDPLVISKDLEKLAQEVGKFDVSKMVAGLRAGLEEASALTIALNGVRDAQIALQFADTTEERARAQERLNAAIENARATILALARSVQAANLPAETTRQIIEQLLAQLDQLARHDAPKSFADSLMEAVRAAQTLQEVLGRVIADFLRDFVGAWEQAVSAWVEGSKSMGQAFRDAMLDALASVARAFAEFFLARAAGALAEGLEGNPGAFAAAAQFTAAAIAMSALAGILGGMARGSQTASREQQGFAGETGDIAPAESRLIIKGGLLDVTDPRQARALADAVNQLRGRRIIIEAGG